MNIIIKEKGESRISDGIDTILNLDNDSFSEVIETLTPSENETFLENINVYYTTDNCEAPDHPVQLGLENTFDNDNNFIGRGYFGCEKTSINSILSQLKAQMNSSDNERIEQLLDTRGPESLKIFIAASNFSKELIDKTFSMLEDPSILDKFLSYKDNEDSFTIDGKIISEKEYLRLLFKLFGAKKTDNSLSKKTLIFTDFYLENIDQLSQSYSKLYDTRNMDRFTDPNYEFRNCFSGELIRSFTRKNQEPNWDINQELRTAVLSDMPDDLSLEEKSIYIYLKLCQELKYDEEYMYNDYLKNKSSAFVAENLKSITPQSKVVCWDFSRLYANFINELDGDIEAVVISEGVNDGHFLIGVYTDSVSFSLEPTNIVTDSSNDFTKVQNGMRPLGIKINSDKQELIPSAIDKVFSLATSKEPLTVNDYLEQLKQLPQNDIPDCLEAKLEAFIEIIGDSNIRGNEATHILSKFEQVGFFGEKLEKAFIGQIDHENNSIDRLVLLRKMDLTKDERLSDDLYELNLNTVGLRVVSPQSVMYRLNNNEIIYENKKRTLRNITKEAQDDDSRS